MRTLRLFRIAGAFAFPLLATAFALAAMPPDPQIGYVYPPAGAPGTTHQVQLAGSLWTPDIQFFVHDERVKLEVVSKLTSLLMPAPPYLIGTKAYSPPPLPRELSVRIVLPADVPPGPIHWQVANANGASSAGVFIVGDGREVLEEETQTGPQLLKSLPVTVSGRLYRNEEIDRYRFRATRSGPITCELTARRLGSQFHGLLEIRDQDGRRIADEVDTQGTDLILTFSAKAQHEYTIALRDLDFRGNRAFIYRLAVTAAPRVVAAIPAGGRPGETRTVEFVGIGIATGARKLESVKKNVTFPINARQKTFDYPLQTEFGTAAPFPLHVTELPQQIETDFHKLTVPVAVTGVLEKANQEDRYHFTTTKDQQWEIKAVARSIASPLDVNIAIIGPDGKLLAENDDSPGTSDASILWTAPADGDYEIVVGDSSGNAGNRAAVYQLIVAPPFPDFSLTMQQRHNVVLGGKSDLTIKAVRSGGFNESISLTLNGLPTGISAANELTIPAGKSELKISLESAADVAATASLVSIIGTAKVGDQVLMRLASAPALHGRLTKILIATTMKPRFNIRPIESDERTVHRGSTHLAPIGIERLEKFNDPIVVTMDSLQPHKFRQGIFGPDVTVPEGADQVFFPCFVPERSETLDAYRMLLTAVAEVPDPRGNLRTLIARMPSPDTSIAITVEGALLKIGLVESTRNFTVHAGQSFDIPIRILRSAKLAGPVRLEIHLPKQHAGLLQATPIEALPDQDNISLKVNVSTEDVSRLSKLQAITIRATAMQRARVPELDKKTKVTPLSSQMLSILDSGHLPVISEIQIPVKFVPDTQTKNTSDRSP